ncbi:hypothetical protein CEXT_739461 [Caerostris extrusa]|uniref:Uncharacterized protein n=1 Tax=Caerostris extrusa TaxID=172846 RepID=A0AAV4R4K1_CAEEX|nr:hypothetical protein CEXT_739461 [Caerostris extrusa]
MCVLLPDKLKIAKPEFKYMIEHVIYLLLSILWSSASHEEKKTVIGDLVEIIWPTFRIPSNIYGRARYSENIYLYAFGVVKISNRHGWTREGCADFSTFHPFNSMGI